ncbi:hypothetical protein INR49_031366 [Caranx melampygus]|nr:hypothetical protein INR49_031366 [Caranx melampygus]
MHVFYWVRDVRCVRAEYAVFELTGVVELAYECAALDAVLSPIPVGCFSSMEMLYFAPAMKCSQVLSCISSLNGNRKTSVCERRGLQRLRSAPSLPPPLYLLAVTAAAARQAFSTCSSPLTTALRFSPLHRLKIPQTWTRRG